MLERDGSQSATWVLFTASISFPSSGCSASFAAAASALAAAMAFCCSSLETFCSRCRLCRCSVA